MTVTDTCWLRRKSRLLSAALAVLVGIALGTFSLLLPAGDAPTAGASAGFVGRQGTTFVRDGAPFRPFGVNYYNAAGDPAIFECGATMADPDVELAANFARIRSETGSNVVRFWAFQSYTNGGTDWRGLDRVVRLAREQDLLLLPVLENQWADCTRGAPRAADWYAGRYTQPDGGYSISFEEYVRRVVSRYRDEPAILAWTLVNEAEARRPDGSGDPDALYGFAEQMSRLIKSLDPNHMVALGTIGRGQPGTAGASFERLHAIPTLDLLTYHDYQADSVPLPGARLEVAGFAQDQGWRWQNGEYLATRGRDWETVTYQLPTGDGPGSVGWPRRIGLTMFGDFSGALYVDQIQVGSQTYDFEDGTTQGWYADGTVSVEPASDRAVSGAGSLRVQVRRPEQGAQLWLDVPSGLEPGATLSARVLVETPGTAPPPNTLAAAMATSVKLDKPLLVGEAGLATCEAPAGMSVHTTDERATRLDAKIDAFFRVGGAGYLIWAWNPSFNCSFAFSSGDPLNAILSSWSARLTAP